MSQSTATRPVPQHRPPSPMEAFRPVRSPDVVVPQLAIDTLALQIASDPKLVAEQFLTLVATVNVLVGQREEWRRANEQRALLHPTTAELLSKRIVAVCDRLDTIEDRLDGQPGEKSIEGIRESVGGLIARECV